MGRMTNQDRRDASFEKATKPKAPTYTLYLGGGFESIEFTEEAAILNTARLNRIYGAGSAMYRKDGE